MPETVTDAQIGAKLGERRQHMGWSQKQAGEVLGVSYQQWHKFERGQNRLAATQLAAICEAMHLSADDVLGLQSGAPADPLLAEVRTLVSLYRALPQRERRELVKAARDLVRSAPAPATDAA